MRKPILLGVATWILAGPLSAALLYFNFTAVVTSDLGSPVADVGDPVLGFFAYDVAPTTATTPNDPRRYAWDRPRADIGATIYVNGSQFTQHPDNFARLAILDQPDFDHLLFYSYIGPRTHDDEFLVSGPAIIFTFDDETATAFDTTDLPTDLTLDMFPTESHVRLYDGVHPFFEADLVTLELSSFPLPEPTVLYSGLGAALACCTIRRRTR